MKNVVHRRPSTHTQMVLGSLKTTMLLLLALVGYMSKGYAQCTPPPQAPTVTPSNYTPCIGSSIQVTVTNMYLPNANWTASLILTGGSMPITSNGTYTIPVNNSGNLYVYIQNNVNNCPNVYQSSPVAVNAIPSNKPSAQSDTVVRFCSGDSKFLYVNSPNSSSNFQWKKNGVNIGTNNDTLFLNNMVAADTGNYKCIISSSTCPTDSSKNIKLQLGSIISQSANANLCVGGSGILWVNAPSANGFVWKLNGVAIPNTNNDTLFISNYSTAQAGTYTCEATQNGSCLSTANFTVSTNTSVSTFDFTGVIASYPMSGNANNAASTSYNGTVNAGCTLTTDRNGNANRAYNFNGATNGTINMGDITPMNGAGQLSLSGWFKRNTSLHNEYFSKVIDSSGLFAREYSNNHYTYNTFGNNSSAIPSGNIGGGWANWFHYTMTFNGGNMKIYINGVLATQFTNAAKPTIQSAAGSSFILGDILGAGTVSYPSTNFVGQMDEINIFNRDLNATEILALMNAPHFLQHPQNATVCAGNTLSLSVQAESANTTFQWQKNGADIVGANAATYTKANAQAADAGAYTCVIAVDCNRSISKAATVTVSANSTNITSQPQAQSKCVGQSASFSITATGGTGYQWRKNGAVLSGQTAATLNLATVALSDTGTYTCDVLGGSCGTLTSTGAYLTVNALPSATISGPSAVCAGGSVTLTASGGTSYQWTLGGGNAATATFTPTATTTYAVVVTDANNCSIQATKLVTRNALPTVTVLPTTVDICSGFSQNLTAGGASTYSWSNGLGTGNPKSVSPTSTTTYTVTGTDANNCSATASATVNVLPSTAITTQPQTQTTCVGGQVNLSVVATGQNVTYQWKKGGVNIPSATNATYTISSAVAGDAGSYTVAVNSTCGPAVTSSAAVLTVTGSLQISQQPQALNLCVGSNGILAVTANGAGVNYTWKKNGTAIANSNNDTLFFNNLSAADAGSYTCDITSNCGNATSTAATVTVKQPTSSTQIQSVCFGGSFSFNGATLTQSGTYRDTLVNAAGCDSIIILNFTVRPQIVSNQSQALCNGASIVFNGQTITGAGTYRDTLVAANGCDSIVILAVNVAQSSTSTLTQSACGSYSFNGQTLTTSGTYLDTITNVAGCDSFITLNLTINVATTSTANDTICAGTTLSFGTQTLSASGTYTRTIPNAAGCDSVITLNLFVRPALSPTINQSGFNLSTQSFSAYQWKLNGSNIAGATTQNHTATANGSYTVLVTDANGCSAISAAVQVTGVGIANIPSDIEIAVYPNPFAENIQINTSTKETFEYSIFDMNGKLIVSAKFNQTTQIDLFNTASGNYLLMIKDTNGNQNQYKLVKQ